MSSDLPALDIRAVRTRIDDIACILTRSRSLVTAAFELIEEGRVLNSTQRFLRDLDVLKAAELTMEHAENMLNDLLNNPPTISESEEIHSSNILESTL